MSIIIQSEPGIREKQLGNAFTSHSTKLDSKTSYNTQIMDRFILIFNRIQSHDEVTFQVCIMRKQVLVCFIEGQKGWQVESDMQISCWFVSLRFVLFRLFRFVSICRN